MEEFDTRESQPHKVISPDKPHPECIGDETEAASAGCGWGRFRPKILAPFAHVWTFIVLYIVFSFTHAVQGSYPIAILTTLERRFNIPSSLAGFIINTSLLGYVVSIVIVSIFFAKGNTPRLFAISMLLTSIAAFLFYLPHVVCSTGNDALDAAHAQMQTHQNITASLSENGSGSSQLCGDHIGLGGPSEGERTCSAEDRQTEGEGVSYVLPAVVIVSIADLFHGFAGAPNWIVGLAFVDSHTDPELSAKIIGLMYTVRLVSPIVSFAMGGYFLSIHTTLKETGLNPKDPQWIGAWWMGFLINAVINFLIFIPMSMLPRNLRAMKKPSSISDSPEKGKTIAENVRLKETEMETENEEEEVEEEEQNREVSGKKDGVVKTNQYRNGEDETEEEKDENEAGREEKLAEEMEPSLIPSTNGDGSSVVPTKPNDVSSIDRKEFPKAMIRLVTNPIYVLTVLAVCSDWSASCFTVFVPKYLQVHFQKTASVASLLGGMISAIFAAVASYAGGVVAGKIKGIDGGVTGLCRMNLSCALVGLLLFIPALNLSCPNILYSGQLLKDRRNLTTDCNVNCGCSSDVFDPVCGSDGVLYFSPCHAGCTQMANATVHPNDLRGRLVRSTECRCVAEVEGRDEDETGKVVFAGLCDDECSALIPYMVILVAIVVVSCLDKASSTTIILRCTKQADKTFALGLHALCISLALLPAPILYGMVFDESCILKSTAPCAESKGSCQLYDRHALRLRFHGLAMGLRATAAILFCVAYILTKRKLSLQTAQQKLSPTRLREINDDTK